jgi:peptidoglycan/xylan/chitin deacetylase (PgdA/CDA1 family)
MDRPQDFDPRQPLALRRVSRQGLEGLVYWTGLSFAYLKAMSPTGAVILTYHSVAAPGLAEWIDPRNRIDADRFARQAEFLATHRRVISLDELADAVESGEPLPAGSVVLTFDDGYRDTLEVAAPILARYGLPAMLYVPTAIVTRREPPWSDLVYSWFRTRRGRRLQAIDGLRGAFDLTTASGATAAHAWVSERLLRSWPAERGSLLAQLQEQLDPAGEMPRLTASWDELRDLRRRSGDIEIGLHTAEHVDLTAGDDDSVRGELSRCIADAERELGTRPRHFAYPYDRASAQTRTLMADQGFRTAVCAGRRRCLISGGVDRLALPRLNAPPSATLLRFWTSGAYPTLSPGLAERS